MPLLCLVLFAIVQFGFFFQNYLEVTSAAREGARKAAVSRGSATAVADVRAAVTRSTSSVNDARLDIAVSPATPWTAGDDVRVTVTYPFSFNLVGVGTWSVDIRAESVVRVE